MEHVFGPIPREGLGPQDRLCNEPRVPGTEATRTFHVHYEMSGANDGDFVCKHCGATFLDSDLTK